MARYKISQKGVHDPDGKEVPVGTILPELPDGESLPTFFLGKVTKLDEAPAEASEDDANEGKVLIVNPADAKVDTKTKA